MGCKLGDCVVGEIVVFDRVEPMLVTFTEPHSVGHDSEVVEVVVIVFSDDGYNQFLKFIVKSDFEYASYTNINDWEFDAT